jgi:hypothetical protein
MNVQKPDLETYSGFEVEVSRTRVKVKMSERVVTICLIPLSACGIKKTLIHRPPDDLS